MPRPSRSAQSPCGCRSKPAPKLFFRRTAAYLRQEHHQFGQILTGLVRLEGENLHMGLVVVVLLEKLSTTTHSGVSGAGWGGCRATPAPAPRPGPAQLITASRRAPPPAPYLFGVGIGVPLDEVLELGQVAGQLVSLAARHGDPESEPEPANRRLSCPEHVSYQLGAAILARPAPPRDKLLREARPPPRRSLGSAGSPPAIPRGKSGQRSSSLLASFSFPAKALGNPVKGKHYRSQIW